MTLVLLKDLTKIERHVYVLSPNMYLNIFPATQVTSLKYSWELKFNKKFNSVREWCFFIKTEIFMSHEYIF